MPLDEHVRTSSCQGSKVNVFRFTEFPNSYVLRTLLNTEKKINQFDLF